MYALKTNFALVALFIWATGMFGQLAPSENTLQLRSGTKILQENAVSFFRSPQQFRHAYESEQLIRYVQFFRLPSDHVKEQLHAHGVRLLQYVTNQTYIASIPSNVIIPENLQTLIRSGAHYSFHIVACKCFVTI